MADYYPLIARAVSGLDKNTGENRRALYDRARVALVNQLRGVQPALEESDITRERLALEEAIRKMTSWPATRMRLASRGMIKEGNWADVVIFDYDKIQDRSTYEKPVLTPVGIDYVLVNGQVVIENGKHTGARPGKVLYGPGRQL